MAVRIFDFRYPSDKLLGGLAGLAGMAGPIVILAGMLAAEWLFLYFLYKKRVFLKI